MSAAQTLIWGWIVYAILVCVTFAVLELVGALFTGWQARCEAKRFARTPSPQSDFASRERGTR